MKATDRTQSAKQMGAPAPADPLPAIFADDRVLSAKQMAVLFGLSVATIRRLHRRGALPPAIQLSERRIGWRAGDARAALAASRPAPDPQFIKKCPITF
jgi:predicted DNA-binding transcriptional regulator AlpA